MKTRTRIILIADALAVIITAAAFILTQRQLQLIGWLSRGFILFTEILSGIGIAVIDRSAQRRGGLFIRSGAFSTILAAGLLSVLISLYFMTAGGQSEIFLTLQVIVLGDGAIMVLVILYKGPCTAECRLSSEEVRARMQDLEDQVLMLAGNLANRRAAPKLCQIAESIRYSDNSAVTSWDYKMNEDLAIVKGMLEASERVENAKIDQKIEELLWILDQRRQAVKRLKAGKI